MATECRWCNLEGGHEEGCPNTPENRLHRIEQEREIERMRAPDRLDTLLAGLKAEAERLRGVERSCQSAAESLPDPNRGVALIQAREAEFMADRLEHLIKQAGGEQ